MPTECNATRMGFARVDGRAVVADFEGGAITSNAGDHWRVIRTRCGPPSSLERWISSGTGESARGVTLVPRVALCVSF